MALEEKIWKCAMESRHFGLFNGKMGACVALLVLSKHDAQNAYYRQGGQLLDEVLKNVSKVRSIELEEGLIGIALGFRFLISNGYVKGTVNSYLENLDEYIFTIVR